MGLAPVPLPGPAQQVNHQRSADKSYDVIAVLKDGTIWHAGYNITNGAWYGWEQV